MNTDDKLSQIFDVEPIVIDEANTEIITADGEVIPPQNNQLESDYELTRANLYTLLQQGQDALNHALEVAKQSEHPRAFEVVSGLMKDIADINHKLLDIHKKKQAIQNPPASKQAGSTPSVTNNAIFLGNTAELSKLLGDMRKEK